MKIETQRLIIRDFKEKDLEAYHRLTSNPRVAYYAGFKPHPTVQISKYALDNILIVKDYFAITLKNGTIIGDLNLYKDPIRKSLNAFQVGFILDETYWHQGYMQEALKGFIPFIFELENIDIISCVCIESNERSIKTIEALGFKYDGIIRHYKKLYNGDIVDCKLFTMTKDEFERNEILCQKN